jgi:Uncharacterized protein involved in tolerance to divalent cations
MKTNTELLIGMTTVPTLEIGREISKFLITEKLAACTQISESPVISCYIWKDQINEDKEYELTIKFLKKNAEQVKEALLRMHPYETPQWYAFEPELICKKYAFWAEK